MTMTRLTLTRPDDWHLHLRDGEILASVLPDTARRFARAIVMPNLKPPVITTEQALAYRECILAALPASMSFEPLMTLHLTTSAAAEFVSEAPDNVAATLTAHHLLLKRNAMLEGGLWPHHYCLPLLKREAHRRALVAAATGGNPTFFLGTDSAPHPRHAKESACGCAGI